MTFIALIFFTLITTPYKRSKQQMI